MTSLPAKVIAIEERGDQYQVIVQISTKYRGSFNTLAFGEIKPYIGSLKDGRLDLVYYRDPGLSVGDHFLLLTLHYRVRENIEPSVWNAEIQTPLSNSHPARVYPRIAPLLRRHR